MSTKQDTPDKELILDWMRMAHDKVEAEARAKQKAIWQSQLDEAAAEYIGTNIVTGKQIGRAHV